MNDDPKRREYAAGGGIVPVSFADAVAAATTREFERIDRNIAAEAKARAAGEPGYLRESSFGDYFVEFTPPPPRRVRARRAIAEARRRLSEAVLVVRTGSTSYEDDL